MSYTLTIDEPEVVSYATRQGVRFRDELRSLVLAFVTEQMRAESLATNDRHESISNGKAVFDALRACPDDVDFDQLIPRRTCVGRAHSIDFAALLRDEA